MLDDGTYDALVVDATPRDDGGVSIELTIVAGELAGDPDPLDLLGIPATLTVTDGAPSLRLEP